MRDTGPTDKRRLLLDGFVIPPPVFTRSVEARSQAEEKDLQAALAAMLLEDPSLQLGVDKDTGQTLLSGQGELHLEIVADRLRTEHHMEARLGPMVVAYREALLEGGVQHTVFDREVGGKRQFTAVTVRVAATDLDTLNALQDGGAAAAPAAPPAEVRAGRRSVGNGNVVVAAYAGGPAPGSATESSRESVAGAPHLSAADLAQALTDGASSALARGPLLGYALAGVEVTITAVELTHESTLAAVAAAASTAGRAVLAASGTAARLLEPLMRVTVVVGVDHMGNVLADLTGVRRGRVLGIEHLTATSVRIDAEAPLSAMAGYASGLRSVSSGYGTFSMYFSRYGLVPADDERAILTAHGWRPPTVPNDTV